MNKPHALLSNIQINYYEPQKFDLIITDYGMPKMNGYGDLVAKENIHQWGINDLLMKPFELQGLSEIIRSVLNNKTAKV